MARPFFAATAEQMVSAAEAVQVLRRASSEAAADFADLTVAQATNALRLAEDLGLICDRSGNFEVSNPLVVFLSTTKQTQKASVVRIVLESYEPFVQFRVRLVATGNATEAARQVRSSLALTAHREEIKDTLVSLGTYSQTLVDDGGGRYRPTTGSLEEPLRALASACDDQASAEQRVALQLGENVHSLDRQNIIVPLALALIRAKANDPRGAVVEAGNAVESFLVAHAASVGLTLSGATGINSKIDRFDGQSKITKKLCAFGKFLGNVRNAADHGVDPLVGSAWSISAEAGVQFVMCACTFIRAVLDARSGRFVI